MTEERDATSPGAATSRDHFASLVAAWEHFGPPLRPWPEDTGVVQRVIDSLGAPLRAVVLGLTPETMGCDWPDGTELLAVDHSPAMIRALWPAPRQPPGARVVCADWSEIPLPDGSVDLVTGDGVLVLLAWPDGATRLLDELARVLRPGGRVAIRCFLRTEPAEPLASIAAALERGEIPSVHALKLRLLSTLHGASGAGTRLGDVWDAWSRMRRTPSPAGASRGWTAEEIVGIDSYRDLDTRYHLPTDAEVRALLAPRFDAIEHAPGGTFVARRTSSSVTRR